MSQRKYNERDLFEFASQLLLEEKKWEDFEFLSNEEKGKLLTILRRGQRMLESHDTSSKSAATSRKRMGELFSKESMRTTAQGAHARQGEVLRLAQRVAFVVFPLDVLIGESDLVRRKVMEVLNRRLSPTDLSLLLMNLPEDELALFLNAISPRLAEEIHALIKSSKNSTSEHDIETVLAKYSVEVIRYLKDREDISETLQTYVKEYFENLKKHLDDYCKGLPKKLGVLEKLSSFNDGLWKKLTGLTPRSDMALLAEVLPQENWEKLISFLPAQQKEDVRERVTFNQRERQREIRVFVDYIQSVKHFLILINKVSGKQ